MIKKTITHLTLTLFTAVLALCLWASPLGLTLERFFYDRNMALADHMATPSDIIILAIDDNTIRLMAEKMDGLKWPYPRTFHARVANHLYLAGAKAVFMDILFAHPSRFGEEDDLAFKECTQNLPVVLAGEYSETSHTPPLSYFIDNGAYAGNVSLPLDMDHCIRNMRNSITFPMDYKDALAWLTSGASGGHARSRSDHEALPSVEQILFTLTCPGQAPPGPGFIHFFGSGGSVETLSWFNVFDQDLFFIHKDKFKDKVVFIGKTAPTTFPPNKQPDVFPVAPGHASMASVEIHANAFASLIHKKTKYLISPVIFNLAFFLFALLSGIALNAAKHPVKQLFILAGLLILLVPVVHFEFINHNNVIPIVPFIVFGVLYYLFTLATGYLKTRHRNLITRAQFFHYLPEKIAKQIIKQSDQETMAAQKKEVTLLSADIIGVTRLSQSLSPEEFISLVQDHLSDMTIAVLNHQGTLDKYVGAGILAFWGAPVTQENQADMALQAAMEMLDRLDNANRVRRTEGSEELRIRIGLHTGEAVIGNVGALDFIDYTALGENVDTASHIEKVSSYFNVRTTISGKCIEALKGDIPDAVYPLARIMITGRKEPVNLYTLADRKEIEAYTSLFEFLTLMDQHDFTLAEHVLYKLLQKHPNFGPALFHQDKFAREKTPMFDETGQPYWPIDIK